MGGQPHAASDGIPLGGFADAGFHRATAPTPPRRGFSAGDWPRLAWRHRWLLLASIWVGVSVGAVKSFLSHPPTATALLLSRDADGPTMQTEVSIFRSQDILRKAVEQTGPLRVVAGYALPSPLDMLWAPCSGLAGERMLTCAMALTADDLTADIDGASGILSFGADRGRVVRLTARNANPSVSVDLLKAAIDAEVVIRRRTYAIARADTLRPQLQEAEDNLTETTNAISRIRSSSNVLDISRDIAAVTQAQSALSGTASRVLQRQTAVQAELAKVRTLLQRTPEQIPFSKEVSTRDTSEASNTELMRLRLERAHLVQLYSKDYPGLQEIDRKISIVSRKQAPLTDTVSKTQRNPAFETLSAKLASLEAEDASLASQFSELTRQQGAMTQRADELGASQAGLARLTQKLEVQQAVARQLSLEIAQLQSQDTLTADRVDDLQVLQAPMPELRSWTHGGDTALAGVAGGTAFGLLGLLVSRRRLRFYTVPAEVERDLGLPALADLVLWRRGTPVALPDFALSDVAQQLLEATNEQGGPVTGLHLASTTEDDGAHVVGRSLAAALLAKRGGRVLIVHLEPDGLGFIESIIQDRPSSGARAANAPSRREISVTIPAPSGQTVALANVASAVLGDWAALGGPLQLHVARLRSAHDFVIVVSAHGTPGHVMRRLSSNADLDVLVVRAGHSEPQAVIRLSALLQRAGDHRFGFIFTRAGALFSGRHG
jgi:uncharacterized protein involved in exopolysaccharide biosynthesis